MSVDFHDARRIAWGAASALPTEHVPLGDAVGRVLATAVTASTDVPHYASSAMDGWAVAGEPPWRLADAERTGDSPGGAHSAIGPLAPGEAVAIVTGGLVPSGADAILRSEDAVLDDVGRERTLTARERPTAGRHIRPIGEEVRRGDVVIRSGVTLNPVHVAVAAGCGADTLEVRRHPRIALVLTGDEVVESGIPRPGEVRDSFGPMLPSVVGLLGGTVVSTSHLGDDRATLLAALTGSDADLIITTGGTGHSRVDHLRAALEELSAKLLVDGLALRPGAPSVLARLPDGTFITGLPGNPLAAMMALLTLAHPLMAGMLGDPIPPLGTVSVAEPVRGVAGRTLLLPYVLRGGGAVPSGWRGSGMLRGLAEAAGVLVCPETGAASGELLPVLPLPWRP